jgi:hypothetical protein
MHRPSPTGPVTLKVKRRRSSEWRNDFEVGLGSINQNPLDHDLHSSYLHHHDESKQLSPTHQDHRKCSFG